MTKPDLTGRDDELAVILGDAYQCTRSWEAWQFGTMTEADFLPAAESEVPADLLAWRDAAVAAERELLDQAERVLHGLAIDLLAQSHLLRQPFTDRPDLSPWTRTTGRLASHAHDLAVTIRKHLGLPHRWALRGVGAPLLEVEQVVAAAVAAERERIAALADQHNVGYNARRGLVTQWTPFADLIRQPTPEGDPQ